MTFTPFSVTELAALEARFQAALQVNRPVPLGEVTEFPGAGVYVLFYHGPHRAYAALSGRPIYVGKAMPAGGRKGLAVAVKGKNLFKRIMEHKESVASADDLDVKDFTVQWLTLDPLWVGLCESLFISYWKPVWNAVLDGFGNHDPGAGRRAGVTSRWDAFHPGRSWSRLGKARVETADMIESAVRSYLEAPVPAPVAAGVVAAVAAGVVAAVAE